MYFSNIEIQFRHETLYGTVLKKAWNMFSNKISQKDVTSLPLLPMSLLAHLVGLKGTKQIRRITEVMDSVQDWIFLHAFFSNCLSSIHKFDDLHHFDSLGLHQQFKMHIII